MCDLVWMNEISLLSRNVNYLSRVFRWGETMPLISDWNCDSRERRTLNSNPAENMFTALVSLI